MVSGRRRSVLFIEVPEPKADKNCIYSDLRPVDGTRYEELDRPAGLGACPLHDLRLPDGRGWMALANPENKGVAPDREYCIRCSSAHLHSRSEHMSPHSTYVGSRPRRSCCAAPQ